MHFSVEISQGFELVIERLKWGAHSCVSLAWINVCSEGSNTNSLVSSEIPQVSADEKLCFGLDWKNDPVTQQKIRQKI